MFLPMSSKLRTVTQDGIKRSKENIRVVETGGTSIKQLLQRSNPNREPQCRDVACWVCQDVEGGQKGCLKGSCGLSNVGYVITCLTCQERGIRRVYEGESGRSGRIRSEEHLSAFRRKHTSSVLYQHVCESHEGEESPRFKFQVRERFRDALTRQVEEGVRIENSEDDHLLNTKSEWVPPALGRVRIY